MTLEEWGQIIDMIVGAGGLTLAYIWWYTIFSRTSKNNDEEFCDKIQEEYPEGYDDLMKNSERFRKTCCRFSRHSGRNECK
jgi:hypothetical protein